ncbi:hypothetical protein CAEBREN_07687 [Caenorhabditis brenneri]|uniref:F-box domain-containing protein n=1 Tax=Caenorhabditis brenneri TaxID=135651 RepID=G0N3V0_CAEBE|nr:hypothetical protein CAEBREN_07687 [Caenorhabditis brenneri]
MLQNEITSDDTTEKPLKIQELTVNVNKKSKSIHLKGSGRLLKFQSSTRKLDPIVKCAMEDGHVERLRMKIEKPNRVLRNGLFKVLLDEADRIDRHHNWDTVVFETNWIDLPEKLKRECIDRMSFKTRMRLGMTSKTEKSIIDSHQAKFDFVKIDENSRSCDEESIELSFRLRSPRQEFFLKFQNSSEFIEKGLSLLVFLLKIGSIRILDLEIGDELMDQLIGRIKNLKLRFKKYMNFVSTDSRGAQFIMENCEDGVLEVLCDPKDCEEKDLEKFMELPAVYKANRVVLWHVQHPLAALKLLEKWIQIDSEYNTIFDFEAVTQSTVDAIALKFGDRIELQNEDRVVWIRMNSPRKLIRITYAPFYDTIFRCTVVDSVRPALHDYPAEETSSSSSAESERSAKNDSKDDLDFSFASDSTKWPKFSRIR